MTPDPFAAGSLVWPLCFLLVALCALRKVEQDVRPIFIAVSQGVAKQASGNAGAYAMAIGFGLSASLMATAEQADKLGWVYLAAAAKILNPFIAGCVAYATQNKFKDDGIPGEEKTKS